MNEQGIEVIYGSAGNQIGTFYKCSCCKYYLDKEGIKRHQESVESLKNPGIFNHFKQ
ncbi:22255_t:CDS:1, partial [Racocetra persica]